MAKKKSVQQARKRGDINELFVRNIYCSDFSDSIMYDVEASSHFFFVLDLGFEFCNGCSMTLGKKNLSKKISISVGWIGLL